MDGYIVIIDMPHPMFIAKIPTAVRVSLSLILFTLILWGCEDRETPSSHELTGKWVEEKSTTDTLSFETVGGSKIVVLSRGVISNGMVMRPKQDSGPYDYELLDDNKIRLHWTLSSNSIYNTYYFEHLGEKLKIEQFYENPVAGTILTFRKIN